MLAVPNQTNRRILTTSAKCCVLALVGMLLLAGCSRRHYREWADRDAYSLIESRQTNPSWMLPKRVLAPESTSRLADEHSPDCGPMPPDDPEAQRWMSQPYRFHNNRYWDQIAETPSVENSIWQHELPYNEDGEVEINKRSSIELALLHSRDYQNQVEQLHLGALGLSSNRFEFDTQWFGRTGTQYSGNGRNSFAARNITQSTNIGFSRQLAAGGQLAASLANSLVWNLTPSGPTTSASNIAVTLAQPLLRGAYRHIRLESLTQAERSLLYDVRDFARFRRQFYLNVTQTYLGLLTQTQSLRNQRANLASLERSLREFQLLFSQGGASQIQVDQVFQDYQRGRISLLDSELGYANTLDAFKFQLGLPPRVEINIDLDFLTPFELSDPKFDEIRERTNDTYLKLVQYLAPEFPPNELIESSFEDYAKLQQELETLIQPIEDELERWATSIDELEADTTLEPEDLLDLEQQKTLFTRVETQLTDVKTNIQQDLKKLDDRKQELQKGDAAAKWKKLSQWIGRRLSEQTSELFIIQNQIRLFLIDVTPFQVDQEQAIDMALANRLDLMNGRAQVMDSFRAVEVAADALESDLNFTANVSVGTDPSSPNPIRFDASTSSAQVGLQFDSPINRFNERNAFRSAQIGYQQARRNYMASEDSVVNGIRANLRRLRISRLNFQISRQQLIAATRQVDEAQLQLRANGSGDSSSTRDLLQALQGLLGAKNNLISSWIDYEVGRIELFVDLELLYLNDDGTWQNSTFNPGQQDSASDSATSAADEESAPLTVQPQSESDDPANTPNDSGNSNSELSAPDAVSGRKFQDYYRR